MRSSKRVATYAASFKALSQALRGGLMSLCTLIVQCIVWAYQCTYKHSVVFLSCILSASRRAYAASIQTVITHNWCKNTKAGLQIINLFFIFSNIQLLPMMNMLNMEPTIVAQFYR